jgi:hypothetical protein
MLFVLPILHAAVHLDRKWKSVQMRKSTVIGPEGKSVEDRIRTSYGTFLQRKRDKVIENIEKRLAAWTHLPLVYQEDLQVRCTWVHPLLVLPVHSPFLLHL